MSINTNLYWNNNLFVFLFVWTMRSLGGTFLSTHAFSFEEMPRSLQMCNGSNEISGVGVLQMARSCLHSHNCAGFVFQRSTEGDRLGGGVSKLCLEAVDNEFISIPSSSFFLRQKTRLIGTQVPLKTLVSIPGGLHIGQMISVSAVTTGYMSFKISFTDGTYNNTMFRIRNLMNFDSRNKTAVRYQKDSQWFPWMTVHVYPYEVGKPFHLYLFINHQSVRVYLNGEYLLDYGIDFTDTELRKADMLEVSGDIMISSISLS